MVADTSLPYTTIVELGGISYYLRRGLQLQDYVLNDDAAITASADSPVPATVMPITDGKLSVYSIHSTFARFLNVDDVFQQAFKQNAFLILKPGKAGWKVKDVPQDVQRYLDSHQLSLVILVCEESFKIPQGPYFIYHGKLHEAWRLYPDDLGAFTTSVIPDDETPPSEDGKKRYRPFHFAAFTGSNSVVPVPSRLYGEEGPERPLAGMRITVKDNMHLRGVVTTLGSRSYAELYGVRDESAEYVDILIAKGAVVIGKTKLAAFASGQEPRDAVDYLPPWNPRGDGYQSPAGSSSGAGASIAGYDWIDVSLGTDTTGSLREPASANGVWGHKVTWSFLPMKGIVESVPQFDSIGIFAREPSTIAKLLLFSKKSSAQGDFKQRPVAQILYPTDWYPCRNKKQQLMTAGFLEALEAHLDILITPISLMELWQDTAPREFSDIPLPAFIHEINGFVNEHDIYYSLAWFHDFHTAKLRKAPYLSFSRRKQWKSVRKKAELNDGELLRTSREEAMSKINTFKTWFEKNVFNVDDKNSMKIMVVPQGYAFPNYRDGTESSSERLDNPPYDPNSVGTIIGAPQVVIPIGQKEYRSKVQRSSDDPYYLPIMTSLMGPKGGDLSLLKIVEETLKSVHWQTKVLTGPCMLEPGKNDHNAKLVP